jgi:hypothetical protein
VVPGPPCCDGKGRKSDQRFGGGCPAGRDLWLPRPGRLREETISKTHATVSPRWFCSVAPGTGRTRTRARQGAPTGTVTDSQSHTPRWLGCAADVGVTHRCPWHQQPQLRTNCFSHNLSSRTAPWPDGPRSFMLVVTCNANRVGQWPHRTGGIDT